MTTIDRAEVMRAVATAELDPKYRRWLSGHRGTDAEGFQVLCSFAPDEPALDVFRELYRYDHPVIVGTIVDKQLMLFEVGDIAPEDADTRDVFPLNESNRPLVDVCRGMLATGRAVAVEFAPNQVLVASASFAPA